MSLTIMGMENKLILKLAPIICFMYFLHKNFLFENKILSVLNFHMQVKTLLSNRPSRHFVPVPDAQLAAGSVGKFARIPAAWEKQVLRDNIPQAPAQNN